MDVFFGLLVAFMLGLFAHRVKALDSRGFVAAVVVGCVILTGGNSGRGLAWSWFLLLITFFVLSSFFTKFRYSRKRQLGFAQDKEGARSWTNTVANGSVAAFASTGELLMGGGVYAAAFVGAVAAATADTLGTEIGLLSKVQPRLITRPFTRVFPGTSGGITPLGSTTVVVSSLLIGGVSYVVGVLRGSIATIMLIAVVAGVAGSMIDSFLGATVQGKYRCGRCGKTMENWRHCGVDSIKIGGIRFVGNDVVNFFGTLAGALSATLLFIFLPGIR